MHYLEDYLEVVEALPSELKGQLSQLKKQEESVQKSLSTLEDKSKTFFTLARKSKPEWRKEQYDGMCGEYEEVLKQSEGRIKMATQVQDLLDKYLRKLDMDLQKFKFELEADSAGITESLEQKSYTLDRPPTPEKPVATSRKRFGVMDLDPINGDYEQDEYFASPMLGYDSSTRRRKARALTASLFLEGETDSLDSEDPMLTSPSKLYTGAGGKPPLMVTSFYDTKSTARRRAGVQRAASSLFDDDFPLAGASEVGDLGYSNIDPDEERYCLCNQVSYGEMVACDNTDCPIEWFHYACVGITEPPKGKWYCPRCLESMGSRKRSRR